MKTRILLILIMSLAFLMVPNQSSAEQYPTRVIKLEDTGLWGDSWGSGIARIKWWERESDGFTWPWLNITVRDLPRLFYTWHEGRAFYSVYIINDTLGRVRVWNFTNINNVYTAPGFLLPSSTSLFTEDIEIEVVFELDNYANDTNVVLRGVHYVSGSPPVVPPAPTDLHVDATTQDSVTLSWTDNATDEIGFIVERSPTSVGPFTTVATLDQDVTTYTQSALDGGRYYHYRVCAYNVDGDTPYTDVVRAMTELIPDEDGNFGYPIPAVADSLGYIELNSYDSNGYATTIIEISRWGPWGSIPEDQWGSWDWVSGYAITTRDPYPVISYRDLFYDPGLDGDFFTGDDPVTTHIIFMYDSAGNRIQRNRYNDPGSDGTWGTGDDQMNGYELYSYDSSNHLIRYMRFNDAGSDGNWFTSDDGVYRTRRWSYDADGKVMMRIESRDPGTDGEWFTPDDVTYDYRIPEYDSNGIAGRSIVYGPGGDGAWFTGDDEVTSSIIFIRDSSGNTLGYYKYRGPGTDGVWFQ